VIGRVISATPMNFIEAAVEILRSQPSKPMHVEELSRLALERKLLSRPAKDPLRSMKGRLTTELKRGDSSRVDKVGPEMWQLRVAASEAGSPASEPASPAAERALPASAAGQSQLDEVLAPAQRPKRGALPELGEESDAAELWGDELAPVPLAAAHEEFRDQQTDDEDRPLLPEIVAPRRDRFARGRSDRRTRRDGKRRDSEAKGEPRKRREGRGSEPGKEESRRASSKEESRRPPDKEESRRPPDREESRRPPGKEESRRPPGKEESRRPPGKEESRRPPGKEENGRPPDRDDSKRAQPAADPGAAPPAGEDVRPFVAAIALADAAERALSSIKGGQSVQVRQLAQMMRKRRLISEDPQKVWGLLKTALLNDERSRRRLGLRPRIVYKGRGLFAMADAPQEDALLEAEAGFARAASELAVATVAALGTRLRALSVAQLERIVHIYLLQTGWQEVAWIKRVDKRTSYALALPAGTSQKQLVGVRAGSDPVPRRGVGELRAGIEAKDLAAGLLIAPREMSAEARAEEAKIGQRVTSLCGDQMAAAFARAGIGVTKTSAPVDYLDDEFFLELDAE